jgi:hypothetical protein
VVEAGGRVIFSPLMFSSVKISYWGMTRGSGGGGESAMGDLGCVGILSGYYFKYKKM